MEKEAIKNKAYSILEDLRISNYSKDTPPTIYRDKISVYDGDVVKEEEGWIFIVGADNWQFDNGEGMYSISFFLDGRPYILSQITGGRTPVAYIYKMKNGKYSAVMDKKLLPK